jgi:hypothetical protein
VVWYVRRRWVKILSVTVLLAVPLLVAYGRLYRGMHHPTDVLAAFLNGLGMCRHRQPVRAQPSGVGRTGGPFTSPHAGERGGAVNRAAFVVNPTKVSSPAALRQRAETFMSRAGWEPPLWLETTEDDPGVGMCTQAVEEGCTVVFVCGGDGTVMAAATALSGTDVPMAILPLGTGNLLARNLDLPLDDEPAALRIGVHGRPGRSTSARSKGSGSS